MSGRPAAVEALPGRASEEREEDWDDDEFWEDEEDDPAVARRAEDGVAVESVRIATSVARA
jgi:hypothetical protein